LGVGKSGSGLDAIHYYRSGEIDKLKKYCLDDVRLTKEIYEFGKKNGLVYYLSKDGTNRLTARVDWKDPAPPANLSLF
jgi:DEAD/DEAH box helicase domain-containing protein